MLRLNERGVIERVPTPPLIDLDIKIDECRRRLKKAIMKARKL